MKKNLTCFKINAPKVIFENYENEVILIHLDSGIYYSITNTAAEIFSQIEQELPKAWILDEVINKYEGNITSMVSSVKKFIADLLSEGLIIRGKKNIDVCPSLDEEKVNISLNSEKLPFESPVLNRYSDTRDLLVAGSSSIWGLNSYFDDTGWPKPVTSAPDPAV